MSRCVNAFDALAFGISQMIDMPSNMNTFPAQNGAMPLAIAAQPPGTNRLQIDCMLAYEVDAASEFVFLIHAATGMGQTLVQEDLQIEPLLPFRTYCDDRSYGI